jgi:plastocyanin
MDGSRLRALVLSIAAAAGTVVIPATDAAASGGGGCGAPVTDASGAEITISNFCFSPTVARVQPGGVVTFRNDDPFAHTVLGANGVWGSFAALRHGDEVTYRLERPGVYPYVCTFHPGMVGVIVVGSGDGPGAAGLSMTARGPVVKVLAPPASEATDPPSDAALISPASATIETGSWPWPAIAIVALGVLALAIVGLVRDRRHRA